MRDGLDEIAEHIPALMRMIAAKARWVHPDTFNSLPLWRPETARGLPRHDVSWTRMLRTKAGAVKPEGNGEANIALKLALDVRRDRAPNWSVCHIWGYDDGKFAARSHIVKDRRFYSCVGNMVLLPAPLKAFTDTVPEIKLALRVCAYHLYGWACEHDEVAEMRRKIIEGEVPEIYPSDWPLPERMVLPPGTATYSSAIAAEIQKRKTQISSALASEYYPLYPRQEVRDVLSFWRIAV